MIEDKSDSSIDSQKEDGTGKITRRRFLSLIFTAATATGLAAFFAPLARYAYPVLKGQVFERQKIATTSQISAEGLRFDYMETPSMVIRLSDGNYGAYSLVCTHLGCIVKWEVKNQDFLCPCHAGKFDENGINISGPPPKPLTKYKLSIEGNDIYVEGLA